MFNKKQEFIEFTLHENILKFGRFTLKSGRISPYFFNTGLCNNGKLLSELSGYYADYISVNSLKFDFIFGPAYKGITLCSSICHSLYNNYSINRPFAFNRKEEKGHGEGGNIIGKNPYGKVLIIDDVLSAGTAGRESIEAILKLSATPSSFIVGLDRQERGLSEMSASKELEKDFNIKVESIVNLDSLIDFVKENGVYTDHLDRLNEYRENWGA